MLIARGGANGTHSIAAGSPRAEPASSPTAGSFLP